MTRIRRRVSDRPIAALIAAAVIISAGAQPAFAQQPFWKNIAASSPPAARVLHTMAYDSARGVAVMFGGYNSGTYYGDTWETDGFGWTQRSSTGPSPRYAHAMAYDSARHVTVLFGGFYYDGSDHYYGDTWEWNGSAWTLRSSSGPSPRAYVALVYDSARARTVLFGGYDGSNFGDTWEWNGSAWVQVFGSGPSARRYHAMAFDAARRVSVLFGGYDGAADSDTWESGLCVLGDIDGDGVPTGKDVQGFERLLLGPAPPAGSFELCRADLDGSGTIDMSDIAPFVTRLLTWCKPGTPGCGWRDGDVVTYNQVDWGTGTSVAGQLLLFNFFSLYPSGVEVGIPGNAGYSMTFSGGLSVLDYLPASGLVGALTADLSDPTSSPSGEFGGNVLALQLDVDYSDAGFLLGASGVRFGDLTLCGVAELPAVNGLTVRQVLAEANKLLGGGTSIASIIEMDPIIDTLTGVFEGGTATAFAQGHIFVGPSP